MNGHYGWQISDVKGNMVADHTVIMSRWLGSYDIGMIQWWGNPPHYWSHRIENIPFNGGTPYCYTVPTPGIVMPDGWGTAYAPPDIYCGPNYIDLSYNDTIRSYPDDLGIGLLLGMLTVHWGVYNA
ncbi:hypothetical protein SMATCC274_32310 [Serratia marcescens]|nr:hypothetical protein SMATCC274_32310 [Serratia marcescens]